MSPGVREDTLPSDHAMGCLRDAIVSGDYPAQEVNFTVRDKLLLHGYVTLEQRSSPYKTHKAGRKVDYLVPTQRGIEAVRKYFK